MNYPVSSLAGTSLANTPSLVLSVVSPVFNEESVISEFFSRVKQALAQLDCSYEIICVDDGNKGQLFLLLRTLTSQDPALKILRFSRNFGRQIAISVGLEKSSHIPPGLLTKKCIQSERCVFLLLFFGRHH